MLNKKAQSEDTFEYILVSIAIVIGIIVLTLGHNFKEFSVDQAMQNLNPDVTDIQSYDSKFIPTDLKNILSLQVSDDYTFAELISHMPENYPNIQDQTLLKSTINNRLGCNEQLFNALNAQLSPVYSDKWVILVYSEGNYIFICPNNIFLRDYFDVGIANLTLPSLDPNENLDVVLNIIGPAWEVS